MKVRVRLFSTLGDLAGTRRVSLELGSGASVADAVAALEELPDWKPASDSEEYLWRHGSGDFTVALNRRHVAPEEWAHRGLRDDDELWLQPPIAGG